MQKAINNKAIIRFLKLKFNDAGFVDSLKIKYRSLICPFISLIGMVKPGDKVGDVGCGSGQFLLLLTEFAQPSYLYGIEISKKLIDNARGLFNGLPAGKYHFEEYDGIHFPTKISELDIVFLIDVLHHVPKKFQENFIRDLAASLKPGARLILKDIDASNPLVYVNKLHDLIFAREIGNEISFQKATSLLTKNGLKIMKAEKRIMYVYPHYTIVAQK